MTPKISLITATVGAALVFAVPAWGDNWAADKPVSESPTLVDLLAAKNGTIDNTGVSNQAIVDAMAEDGFDRAVLAAKQNQLATMLNARERGLGVNQAVSPVDARSDGLNRLYGLGEYSNAIDARERALSVPKTSAPQSQGYDARSDGLNRLYGLGKYASPVVADFDRFRIDHSNEPVTVSATSSGRDIEWPTVGIGFGIGIVLLLGLGMVMKATHTRPFAH